ncbi:MAG: type secretion system minor pseudopilin GspI [Pseudomonadota bacterium]|jgi:general secretion pathway protein I
MTGRSNSPRGLSLVEVLVALLILALTLATASQAISGWLRGSQRQADQLRAQWCADNALTALRLARQMPGTGSSTQDCTQAGELMQVRLEVNPTPNPAFFRVDVQVLARQSPVLRATTILGRY